MSHEQDLFTRHFDVAPRVLVRAPGRINLIGEHTDHQEGRVLPCAIDRATHVAGAARAGREVTIVSASEPEPLRFALGEGLPAALAAARARGGWAAYAMAPFAALAEAGHGLPGMCFAVTSDVPREAGLSSSAAFEVGLVAAAGAVAGLPLTPRDWAELAWRAESHFVGVGCGIMDSFASALGRAGHALRIDCRTRDVQAIPWRATEAVLLVAESGVARRLAAGGYRERLAECAAAVAQARAAGLGPPGAKTLRDLESADLARLEAALEPLPFRRARHVLSENARVDRFAAALAEGDLAEAGACLREGHASLRDDFEVSTPELDLLCASADAHPGCHGSRLVGAGFGGCTLHLVRREAAAEVEAALAAAFAPRFGAPPRVHRVAPAAGASLRTA